MESWLFGKLDCLNMAEQRRLLQQAAEQLKEKFNEWIPKREKSVRTLRALADKLMEHHNNVHIAKVAGSSSSVAGFVLTSVGFGLSFFTFGASLVLSGIGIGVGAAGGATNAGSMIAEACIQKDTYNAAQKIIDDDREAAEAIEMLAEKFQKEAKKTITAYGFKAGVTGALVVKNCVETGLKFGARIVGIAANEGGETFFRGLSVAGRAVHIGGFAFSVIALPFDLYTLVTSSIEIDAARKGDQDNETDAAKTLRKLADELEMNIPNKKDLFQEVDAIISKLVPAEVEM